MTQDGGYHIPVLLHETVDALAVKKDGVYVDGTLGGGGHTEEILKRGGRVIAFDRDADAIAYVQKRFSKIPAYDGRYTLIRDNFKNLTKVLSKHIDPIIDGAVLDLGISSHQVDVRERGFSYTNGAVIDMRMDQSQSLSAKEIVNEYPEKDLLKILYGYGEERNAARIVKAILAARKEKPIETTDELAALVASCFPPFVKGGHPAKRTFQALRIAVNDELTGLTEAIGGFIDVLAPGARLAVIDFHSLEARCVKEAFREKSQGCICPKSLPVCVCGHKASVKWIEKGKRASGTELAQNPRAHSATLRVVEKL
jgi:16S rRNA (cytosine1402-N4)-methyltransferase